MTRKDAKNGGPGIINVKKHLVRNFVDNTHNYYSQKKT